MRVMLKSKIHRATVTKVDADYEGSIGLATDLLEAADVLPYEQVHVLDITSGVRLETYAIAEPAGSGVVAIYGAAARLIAPGDLVIILAYETMPDAEARRVQPRVVYVDQRNTPLAEPHLQTDLTRGVGSHAT